ncbi:hypothetical protein [Nocardioides gansuensis]|uniref:hypothetical protein n=1 Tax=Nocardioides gansuensis TaxID=2138300 RepID=UPI0014035CF4|nr:hypothetical protein [Nocardioides gansuensis]
MTTAAVLLVLAVLASLLVRYARHDRFAGPANVTLHDDFGSTYLRGNLVPRNL